MRRIGGVRVSVDGHRLWSNSEVLLERIGYEKERRHWRNRPDCTPVKTASWNSVNEEAMADEVARREMDFYEINDVQPC